MKIEVSSPALCHAIQMAGKAASRSPLGAESRLVLLSAVDEGVLVRATDGLRDAALDVERLEGCRNFFRLIDSLYRGYLASMGG